jgi:transcriptional regulator with XRE-family HTH domain
MRLERLRYAREQVGYSQQELADKSGVSQHTISEIELGRRKPHGRTLRKLAEVLGVEVADLLGGPARPLAKAPPSQEKLFNNGVLEEERRTAWEDAVENARGLREGGQTRMTELLSLWRASRERQEDDAARLEYLKEMANLLTQANKAKTDLFRNLSWSSPEARRAYKEAKKAGAHEVPNADLEEFLEADRFYYLLRGMIEGQQGIFFRPDLEIVEEAA